MNRLFFLASLQVIQIIRPGLHHSFSLWQIFGMIVHGPDFISIRVSELLFYQEGWETKLMQKG